MRIQILTQPGERTAAPRRRGEPLTFGVPLPRGAVRGHEPWRIVEPKSPAFVQTRVLDRWPDGSVRWMLADAQVDVDLERVAALQLEIDSPTPVGIARSIAVSATADDVVVDTGAARFRLRRGGAFPFDEVVVEGEPVLAPAASGLRVVDGSGVSCEVEICSLSLEERGPLRACIAVTGSIRTPASGEVLRLNARVHLFAGLPVARLVVGLVNPNNAKHRGGFWDLGDAASVYIKDASLSFALASTDGPGVVRCSAERGSPWMSFHGPLSLYQDSSGGERWQSTNHVNRHRQVPHTFRGYRLASPGSGSDGLTGLRATPIVSIEQGPRRLSATMPSFWENFPKAIEADGHTLTLRLFPHQFADVHEIQGGEQKTHECFVSFAPDPVGQVGPGDSEPLEWCRARAVVCVAPQYAASTAALAILAPFDEDHAALVNTGVDGPARFEQKREVVDEYGWRHFGEIYGDHEAVRSPVGQPLVSHYNNQYDPVLGFAGQFLRTADPRWWRLMTDLAAHVIDIDIYHTDRDKAAYNGGMFWHTVHYVDADTATHRAHPRRAQGQTHGGGPSADHNYTTGLMVHYFLTGDEASKEAVVGLADYVIGMDDGRKTPLRLLDAGETGHATRSAGPTYCGPGRGPANSLNALLDGYTLSGERRFLAKAEQIVKRVIHPREDISGRDLDNPERRWFYTMFLQSLGKYLTQKAERGDLNAMYAYGRHSLLHYARWMAAHEYVYLDRPEKLEFPTETWAAQEIRKSDIFYVAALHADGEERTRFIERGAFFFSAAVDTLQRMPTRTLARPVIILLSSGWLHGWFKSHPDVRMPEPAADTDFGAPERFVAQMERAKRRLRASAGIGAALCLLWLLFRLV